MQAILSSLIQHSTVRSISLNTATGVQLRSIHGGIASMIFTLFKD